MACCGTTTTVGGMTWYPELTCQATCEYPSYVTCDPADPSSTCPIAVINNMMVQLKCTASTRLPPGYYVCRQ
jgi:hypothetical protein